METGETEQRFVAMAGVVRRVQERPAQSGGKFAYVSLSDPTADFELMVMPEILPQVREKLQPGKQLVFRSRVRWRDGDLKLNGEGFEPIEAAEARAARDLTIVLSEGAPMAALAELLAALPRTNPEEARPLRLFLRLRDGREIEIATKGLYPAGAAARAAIKAARGVEWVA
jgi:DNA polymerase-3 subunit alpha